MLIFLVTTILVLWFNTDAFVEYLQLLRLKWFKVSDYAEAKLKDCSLTYHTYLLYKHNNFFVRLITCPTCTSFWLCVFVYLLTNMTLLEIPVIFICSLLLYFIVTKLSP